MPKWFASKKVRRVDIDRAERRLKGELFETYEERVSKLFELNACGCVCVCVCVCVREREREILFIAYFI
jgi:hypothetical protein